MGVKISTADDDVRRGARRGEGMTGSKTILELERMGLVSTDAEIERLRAERDDLAAKLEAANAELHELRIKAGMGGARGNPCEI